MLPLLAAPVLATAVLATAGLAPLQGVVPRGSDPLPRPEVEHPPLVRGGFLRNPADWGSIPTSGPAWANVLTWAEKWDDGLPPDLTEADGAGPETDHDVVALACALAWRGSGELVWRDRAVVLIDEAIRANSPVSALTGSALRPGRNLLSYVLAASTIDLRSWTPHAALESDFRSWIHEISEVHLWVGTGVIAPGGTFATYHETRPNNVGLVVGAARIAVDMYLGGPLHRQHLASAKRVFRGFLGHDESFDFADSDFGGSADAKDNSWHHDQRPGQLEGINPVGAKLWIAPVQTSTLRLIEVDVDGCLPDEMRRLSEAGCSACGADHGEMSIRCYNPADSIDWGARSGMDATNYAWEALQGLVMQAYLLHRCGFGAFTWEDNAIERTHRFLYVTYGLRAQDTWSDGAESDDPRCCNGSGNRNTVDDTWVPHIVEAIYDPLYLDEANLVYGGKPGKNCGFADWWTSGL